MPYEAVSVVETDQAVPDPVLVELLKNQAIKMAARSSSYNLLVESGATLQPRPFALLRRRH